jgi:hypothetical protein
MPPFAMPDQLMLPSALLVDIPYAADYCRRHFIDSLAISSPAYAVSSILPPPLFFALYAEHALSLR